MFGSVNSAINLHVKIVKLQLTIVLVATKIHIYLILNVFKQQSVPMACTLTTLLNVVNPVMKRVQGVTMLPLTIAQLVQ